MDEVAISGHPEGISLGKPEGGAITDRPERNRAALGGLQDDTVQQFHENCKNEAERVANDSRSANCRKSSKDYFRAVNRGLYPTEVEQAYIRSISDSQYTSVQTRFISDLLDKPEIQIGPGEMSLR